jgi:hypothetical protein
VEALFASGRVVDIALGALVLEGLVLALQFRRTGRGIPWHRLWPNLLAGAALLLALRAALTGAQWQWVAAALVVALVANLLDLRQRTRDDASGPPHRGLPD